MFKKIIGFITILASCCINFITPQLANATVSPAYTSANSFYFDDFTVDYFLYRDEETGRAKMIVMETITAVFPKTDQNHGITRVIPFTNNDGKNLTMNTGDTIYIDVERNGKEEPVSKVLVGDGYYEVYIGDPDEYVHGEQVYELTYEFEDVILDFDDWQELYWDANGNDWQQRFNSVSAYVNLDESIADKFTGETSCYVGKYGATTGQNRCEVEEFTDEFEFSDNINIVRTVGFYTEKLSAKETLTFDMKFEADTFAPAPPHYSYHLFIFGIGTSIGTGIMLILVMLCWKTAAAKREYYKNLFIKPEYTPAKDISVAEMAQNYIGKGGNGDKRVATLIDLAVNHKVEMIKTEKEGAFNRKHNEWKIRIKTDTLSKQQATVLKILAGSNTPLRVGQEITVKSHSATSELTSLVQKFDKNIESNLEKKDLFVKDKKSKTGKKQVNYTNALSISLVLWILASLLIIYFMFDDEIPTYLTVVGNGTLQPIILTLLIGVGALSIVTILKTSAFATRTEKGLEYSRYMDGLKLYMGMAEAERLELLQSVKGADTTHEGVVKIYEKLLPYAVIFKMEKSWLEELSKYYEFDDVASPSWYMGTGMFVASDFASAMISMNSSLSTSITNSTTSNSSSGFSGGGGGGFAGGGGGGGGGGGW